MLRPADWLYSEDVRIRSESTDQVLDDLDFQLAEFFPISFLDYDDFALEVFVALPEMGVMGWSKLVEIDENVQIQPGPGNVVTGTFAHIADSVIDLLIEDLPRPIGCTSNHPSCVDFERQVRSRRKSDNAESVVGNFLKVDSCSY